MNQMNQIGINKQQKTQKNTKKINFVIFVKSVGKNNTLRQPSCSSGSYDDKEKKIRAIRVIRWQQNKFVVET